MLFIKTILLLAFAQALIYAGVCFLSGQLLPNTLASVHSGLPLWIKLLLFSLMVSVPANLIISKGFRETGPSFAGVVYVICGIIGSVIVSVLVDGVVVRWPTGIALAVMILSAWFTIVSLRSTLP